MLQGLVWLTDQVKICRATQILFAVLSDFNVLPGSLHG